METKWYVVRSVTGKEKKVKETLETEIKNLGYSQYVNQVVIPMEKIFHLRKGKKVSSERNYYPGYILIEAHPSIIGELVNLKKTVKFIAGFLGDNNPIPLRQEEVDRILGKMDELQLKDEETVEKYIIGELVKICDGPFNSFTGTIEKIDNERRKLELSVKIFGRKTPIELDFLQVKKDLE